MKPLDQFGFDEAARLLALRAMETRLEPLPTLDPPFPYHGRPSFDPDFFGVPVDPPPEAPESNTV
jgi:hypothetical protein